MFSGIPRPAFGRAAQHVADFPKPHKAKSNAKRMAQAKTAAALVADLPAIGESLHCLMTGQYDLTQVIAAVTATHPTAHLRIATLCFSKRNAAELLGLIDSKRVGKLTLLVSAFFKGHNKSIYEAFAEDLKSFPESILTASRSHCKVVTFDLAPDDALVFEGSANLRTNKNIEQLAIHRDRGLHDWHAEWIDGVTNRHGTKIDQN